MNDEKQWEKRKNPVRLVNVSSPGRVMNALMFMSGYI